MKTVVSLAKNRDASAAHPAPAATKGGLPISGRGLHIPILAALGAIVAFWSPAYLAILDHLGGGPAARSEALEWSLFAVGAAGLAGVLYLAWQDTRDPAWRAAHGLPPRPRSKSAAS